MRRAALVVGVVALIALAPLARAVIVLAPTSGGGGTGPITAVTSGPLGLSATSPLTASFPALAGTSCALIFGIGAVVGDPTSLTWNSLSATKVGSNATGNFPESIWYLPIGTISNTTANVVVTTSGAGNIVGTVAEYCHIQQGTTPESAANFLAGTTTSSPVTIAHTSITTGSWVFIEAANSGGGTSAAGTGLTLRLTNLISSSPGNTYFYDSNGTVTPGSNNYGVTFTGGASPDLFAVGFAPG